MSDDATGSRTPDADPELRRRQAPLYGEYATPEEVAALRGPDAPPLVPPEPAPPPPPTGRPLPGPVPEGQRRSPAWDGIVTLGLLGLGAFDVIGNIGGFLHLRTTVAAELSALGYGDVEVPASVEPWGYVLIVVNILLLMGAVALSLRRMRSGRIAFWVPLVAGAVAALLGAIVTLSVLAGSGALGVLQNQG